MRAIDTNLIVRLLVNDDEDQVRRARRLIEAERVRVATTVMLETEWVLRSTYELSKDVVLAGLRSFISHENIELTEPLVIERGLALAEQGLEFADALHLASSPDCASFITFDRPMIRAARAIATIKVEQPEP